jgi:hypothetical protein
MTFVCLQTMWRSCGTYVWSKFRAHPRCYAYFEVCHERLIDESRETLVRTFDRRLETVLRHSGVNGSYFAEFPIQDGGGVPYFKKRFCYDDYFLAVERKDQELERYVGFLLERAWSDDRVPVIKSCRWGLKTAWLDRAFQPTSLYVLRGPDALFRSYWSLGGSRSYFLAGCVLIAARNRDSAIFREMAQAAAIPAIDALNVRDQLAQAIAVTERCDAQVLRDLVLLLWVMNLKHNAVSATRVVDVDLLATSDAYRCAVEQEASDVTGETISFDDVQRPLTPPPPGVVASERGVAIVRSAMRLLPDCDWGRLRVGPESEYALRQLA